MACEEFDGATSDLLGARWVSLCMSTTNAPNSSATTTPDAAPPATGSTGASSDTTTKTTETATPDAAKATDAKAEAPKTDAKTDAKAEAPKADDSTEARIRALEERAAKAERASQRSVKAAYLTGLVNAELLDLVPDVELGADGQIGAAGKAKLDAWKAARPQYFGVQSDAAQRTTPSATRQFTDAEQTRLKASGVDTAGKRGRTLAMLSGGMN